MLKKRCPSRGERWSIDCKATVKIGAFSRGGLTRGDNRARDHDMGCEEKYVPCGIVDEDSGEFYIAFGDLIPSTQRPFCSV